MLEEELMSLGIMFFFAIIGGVIATKLKQPAVIGLLLVGTLIGPHFLNLVNDTHMIDMMAEFGAILLLFVVGLEFVIPKLMKIGFKALVIGIFKIGIITFIIYEVSLLIGISQQAALILGVMFSISSTVVIVKILEAKGLYTRQEMPLLIGALLFEDVFAVGVMTFLSGASSGGAMNVFESLIISLTVLFIAYFVFLKAARFVIPRLIKDGNEEIITFIALGICAGFSYLAYILKLSPAIGAFLAGSVVASLHEVKLFEHAIKPYTLTFTSLFFIAVGTMVDFSVLKENIMLLVILLVVIVIANLIAVGSMSYLFANFRRDQMIFSSIAMISVGEFSLLIAQSAMKLNLGIDFVSISAFIIFTSAIIMSSLINYYEAITEKVFKIPRSINHKPRSFSTFMRALMEEIDTENTHSTTFKNMLFNVLANVLILLFISIAWGRIPDYLQITSVMKLPYNGAFMIIGIYMIIKIYSKARGMFRILTSIISTLYFYGNKNRARSVVTNLLLAVFLLLITVFSPFFVVIFKMPTYLNLISLVLLILVLLRFKILFNLVHYKNHTQNFPRYKKFNEVFH